MCLFGTMPLDSKLVNKEIAVRISWYVFFAKINSGGMSVLCSYVPLQEIKGLPQEILYHSIALDKLIKMIPIIDT